MHYFAIPAEPSVQSAWKSYQALAQVVSQDPMLLNDPDQQRALERAHERFQQSFDKWNAK